MFGYILFIGLIIITCLIIKSTELKNKNLWMLLCSGLIIVLFFGSLDALDFGGDTYNYFNHAMAAQKMSLSEYLLSTKFEDGFCIYLWVTVRIFNSPQAFMFVYNASVTLAVFIFIYDNSKDVFLSIIFYVCLCGFILYLTAFRQATAIAICLFAFMAIKRKHLILSALLILLAMQFHQTSVVFFVVPFLYKRKINTINTIITIAIIAILALNLQSIVNFANEELDMNYGSNETSSLLGAIINIAIYAIVYVLLWFLRGDYSKYDKLLHAYDGESYVQKTSAFNMLLFMSIMGAALYVLRFSVLALDRVANYFTIAFIILLPEALSGIKERKDRDLISFIFVILAVILFLYRLRTFTGYSSVWLR